MIGQTNNVVLGSKTNYLIIKDDVGKAKPTTRQLPDFQFTYGKPDQTNQEGAGQICTSWKTHQGKNLDDNNNPRNFLKLNKKAAIDNCVTAKDNYKYR